MSKYIVGCAILIMAVQSRAMVTFERTYGGNGDDKGHSVQLMQDGGFIVAGYKEDCVIGRTDIYLIRTDSTGDTLWTKTYGGSGDEGAHSVQKTQDGGFIITGNTDSYGEGTSDVYLIRTDSIGDTLWTKTYGGSNVEGGESVQTTEDGGFIIGGIKFTPSTFHDAYLIRTDSVGDTLWTRTYGGPAVDVIQSVQTTKDGGVIAAGAFSPADAPDVYLVKLDSIGDTLWTHTYGGSDWEVGYSVQNTKDGGFVIVGYTLSYGAGKHDVYLIRTDSLGDTLWTHTYGDTARELGSCVQNTRDGGFIIAGRTESYGAGKFDVYLIRTDSLGNTLWTKTYGGDDDDFGYCVDTTKDGGFIVTGETYSSGQKDVYLIKTDAQGNVQGVEELTTENRPPKTEIVVYPNPFTQKTEIRYTCPASISGHESRTRITIYDLSGRLIKKTDGNTIGNDLKAGIYWLKTEGYKPVKIVKLK